MVITGGKTVDLVTATNQFPGTITTESVLLEPEGFVEEDEFEVDQSWIDPRETASIPWDSSDCSESKTGS